MMDLYTVAMTLWPCIQENYPEIAGGLLQIVGAASVIAKLVSKGKVAKADGSPSLLGRLLGLLDQVALNRK